MFSRTCRIVLYLIASSFFGAGAPAVATSFSLLLKGGSGGSNEKVSIVNPYFVDNDNSGELPTFEPSSIVLWPGQFLGDRDLLLEVDFQESFGGKISPAPGGGYSFEINLSDAETGNQITRFDRPIDIGLIIPQLAHLHGDRVTHPGLATHSLDTSVSPPVWRIEDTQIMTCDGDKFCGKTNHLSIFSFGAVPEPSAALLAVLALGSATLNRRRNG